MSFEHEIHGKLGHLSKALSVAMHVIAEIERDLAGTDPGPETRAFAPGAGETPSGSMEAPVYPRATESYAGEEDEEEIREGEAGDAAAAGRATPDAQPARTPPPPPWAYMMPPWTWPAAAMWWPAFFGGWPGGGAPPWPPSGYGWGPGHAMGPAAPAPFGAWPQAPLPWWGGPQPVWPPAPWPVPRRTDVESDPVDRGPGAGAPDEDPSRAEAAGERPEPAASPDPGTSGVPEASSPSGQPVDPWTWRWSNPEDAIGRLR